MHALESNALRTRLVFLIKIGFDDFPVMLQTHNENAEQISAGNGALRLPPTRTLLGEWRNL